jgi:hypothetical protein
VLTVPATARHLNHTTSSCSTTARSSCPPAIAGTSSYLHLHHHQHKLLVNLKYYLLNLLLHFHLTRTSIRLLIQLQLHHHLQQLSLNASWRISSWITLWWTCWWCISCSTCYQYLNFLLLHLILLNPPPAGPDAFAPPPPPPADVIVENIEGDPEFLLTSRSCD